MERRDLDLISLVPVFYILSIVAAFAVWIHLALTPFLPFAYTRWDVIFSVAEWSGGLGLVLAIAGDVLVWRSESRIPLLDSGVASFGLNAGAMLYASNAWFTIPTCGGGLSGPCTSPFLLCGLGLFSTVIGTVATSVGLVRLRKRTTAANPVDPSS